MLTAVGAPLVAVRPAVSRDAQELREKPHSSYPVPILPPGASSWSVPTLWKFLFPPEETGER